MDQWLAYRAVLKPDGKFSKKPIDAKTRKDGSSTDPGTWSTYELAAKRSPVGAGFVLTNEDPYFAADLDNCVDPESGVIEQWAQNVVGRFPMYWETSFSGTGLRGLGRGVKPGDRCRTGNIEVYDDERFVVMTGRTLPGCETIRNCQQQLTSWYNELFPPKPPRPTAPPANLTLEDQDIIDRLRRQNDGGMAGRLLDGDLCDFPSSSEARFSLATRACFYSDNPDQIARILRGSAAWSAKDRDRDRKSDHDAQRVIAMYDGSRYDPGSPPVFADRNRSANGQHDDDGAEDRQRPAIDAGNNDLEVTSGLAWQALQRSNDPPRLFRFGETPVRVGLAENETNPTPQPLTEDRLSHEMARSAEWFRTTLKGGLKPASPPTRVIKDMLAAPAYPLPALRSIVQTPTFAPNGVLQVRPGYHEEGKTFYAPAPGFYVPAVPESPTDEDVEQAKSLILGGLLGEFPFVSASERANAVALFLDPYVRDMINGPTPLRMIESPTPGSGKGLLTEAILRTAIGDHFELTPAPRDDDEWRKQIATKLVKAPLAIVIDNVTAALDSGALATALTMTRWSSRRLGVNEDISVPARALWIVTANNPTMSTEIARRTIRIRLDPQVDRPWQRTGFRHEDLRGWVDAQRPRLVHAALTLIQSWVVAGQPRGTQRLGSFEEWSTLHSGLLAHIGVDGFLANLEAFYESADIETAVWRQFVGSWLERFGEAEVGVSDLFEIAMDTEGIDLGKGSDRAQRITFGRQLGNQRDRVIGDCRIVQSGVVKRVKRWRLVKSRPGGNPFDAFHETDPDNVAGNDRWTR
jgi:hypothetical protein